MSEPRLADTHTARISLPDARYSGAAEQLRFAEDLRRSLIRNDSTGGVAIMSSLPGTYTNWPKYEVEGQEYIEDSLRPSAALSSVLPGSMAVIGIPLLEGRFFDSRDSSPGTKTAIISASMAAKNWPGESALGKRFRLHGSPRSGEWHSVVGVTANTLHTQPIGEFSDRPVFFLPMAQIAKRDLFVAFLTTADEKQANADLRAAMMEVDPDVPAFLPKPYAKRVAYMSGGLRLMSYMFLLFGVVSVVLAGSGIYGVMSNSIVQRTREIGVRRALGATDARVYAVFFKAAGHQLLYGVPAGLILGGSLAYMMAALVGNDLLILISAVVLTPLLIISIALLATWLPVRRALAIEPGVALHHD